MMIHSRPCAIDRKTRALTIEWFLARISASTLFRKQSKSYNTSHITILLKFGQRT